MLKLLTFGRFSQLLLRVKCLRIKTCMVKLVVRLYVQFFWVSYMVLEQKTIIFWSFHWRYYYPLSNKFPITKEHVIVSKAPSRSSFHFILIVSVNWLSDMPIKDEKSIGHMSPRDLPKRVTELRLEHSSDSWYCPCFLLLLFCNELNNFTKCIIAVF